MANATTLARVKAHLGGTFDAAADALLPTLIDSVSREIEKELGYELTNAARTELYSVKPHDSIIFLRVIPVTALGSVKIATDWDFASSTALVATDYHLRGEHGELIFTPGALLSGDDVVEVVYTAGLGTTDAAVIAAAPDIALAADIQVSEEFRRRTNPTTISRPGPKGSKVFDSPHRFLPRVEELLAARRRVLFA